MMNSFYSNRDLHKLGFKSVGKNVFISKKASLYGVEQIEIGNNVRIDDFCILSGNIILGSFIHISAFCALYGRFGIELENYTGLSPRSTIFSATDDFSGSHMIGPMVKQEFTNIIGGKVLIRKYAQIGTNNTILPNLIIGEGAVTGAMSLIKINLGEWGIYAGIPAKKIKSRSKELLQYI